MRIDKLKFSHAVNFIKWNEREMKMRTFIEALIGFAVMFGPALTIWLLQGVK